MILSLANARGSVGAKAMEVGQTDDDLPRLLDAPAVAEHLGISQRHVKRLVADRRIPYVKVGGLVRFDPADVRDWLERAKIGMKRVG